MALKFNCLKFWGSLHLSELGQNVQARLGHGDLENIRRLDRDGNFGRRQDDLVAFILLRWRRERVVVRLNLNTRPDQVQHARSTATTTCERTEVHVASECGGVGRSPAR